MTFYPLVGGSDLRIRIRAKMSRIRNTGTRIRERINKIRACRKNTVRLEASEIDSSISKQAHMYTVQYIQKRRQTRVEGEGRGRSVTSRANSDTGS
jgi:hypothetical protein